MMNSENTPHIQNRVQAVEERLMFQQRLLDELNEVVLGQQKRLDDLVRQIGKLADALQRLADASPGGELPHEKPPHY
ncbi:MAG TPA: SlyX family protein [Lacipirellula sp.]